MAMRFPFVHFHPIAIKTRKEQLEIPNLLARNVDGFAIRLVENICSGRVNHDPSAMTYAENILPSDSRPKRVLLRDVLSQSGVFVFLNLIPVWRFGYQPKNHLKRERGRLVLSGRIPIGLASKGYVNPMPSGLKSGLTNSRVCTLMKYAGSG